MPKIKEVPFVLFDCLCDNRTVCTVEICKTPAGELDFQMIATSTPDEDKIIVGKCEKDTTNINVDVTEYLSVRVMARHDDVPSGNSHFHASPRLMWCPGVEHKFVYHILTQFAPLHFGT